MSEHDHHIVPIATYVKVFLALMVLMTLTVVAAFIDLGAFNPVVALVIACAKATLIVLIFMNVFFSTRLTKIFVGASFFWLLLLFGMLLMDYLSRELLAPLPTWVN